MVSTRGVRYKFSEGERVLCYEPDPTKAKVLYDSKVLEVVESKDKRGRRTVEYLIHFQGWNSSWDRCVSEDFVLKDTEENRQLQRDLADKSQLQLGAYLYRRERKKGGSAPAGSGAGAAKRARHGFSDDGSSSSTQPDATDGNESQCSGPQEAETGSGSESGSGSGSARSPQPRPAAPLPNIGRAQIVLPTALRDRLTFDYHLVVKRGRLSRLPASPCAAHILESFVKWFARAGAWHPRRGRHDPLYKPDLLDVSCRLNLVREVADGLRVYFDFILRGHLLYKAELEQYHTLCGQFIDEQQEQIKSELEDSDSQTYGPSEVGQGEGQGGDPADLKSPKMAEYSHLPPDPDDGEKEDYDASAANNGGDEPMQCDSDRAIKQETGAEETDNTESKPERALPIARGGNVARRLRSHKSCMSESDEPVPSTSAVDPREHMSCSAGSSGSSASDGWCVPNTNESPSPHLRTPLSRLLDKVSKWQIMPSEGTEHLPSRLYGAIHLARLFVKLPDFLNATHMPDYKLKLILKYIDMFVHYMNDHSEWFGEMYYIADNMSRSH